jgi:hypothetical protein
LIGFWPRNMFLAYAHLVEVCGSKFSVGKTYVHPSGGNFTEITFWVNRLGSAPTIRWATGIPLKGLIGTEPSKEGEAFESLCALGGRERKARRVLRALRPEAWGDLRKVGVVPCFPRALGGAGLPPHRGSANRVFAPKWLRLAVGRYLYGSGDRHDPLGPPGWGVSKDPVALAARRRACTAFDQGIEFGMISVKKVHRLTPEEVPLSLGPVFEVVSMETALFTEAACFKGEPLPASASGMAVPSKFARVVHAWARRTLRGGVPDRIAVRTGCSSRNNLLRKVRSNRLVWHVVPLMEGVWPF